MKRRMCLLIVAAVLAIVGRSSGGMAQAQYTISQLREQAAQGWHETYTDKYGREIIVDIETPVYGFDRAPILKIVLRESGTRIRITRRLKMHRISGESAAEKENMPVNCMGRRLIWIRPMVKAMEVISHSERCMAI